MDTQHRIDISLLNDVYGALLTSHQTEMIRLYYDLDVSLGEIADEYSVSRQAVRDAIMRGEKALLDFESKLHILEKNKAVLSGLRQLEVACCDNDALKSQVVDLIKVVEGD